MEERKPERVRPRLEAMLGKDRPFEFEWISIYSFHCRRLDTFLHGPVIFAGDSAHLVSPFGARGFNSGVQDIDNLAWKLGAVLEGQAPRALLATYGTEREAAADENILNSTRSTDFITPEVARLAHHPRRRPVADRRGAVRAAADQLGPPLDAHDLCRHAALDPGHRAVRRHGPARRPAARRAAAPRRRQRGLAPEPARARGSP